MRRAELVERRVGLESSPRSRLPDDVNAPTKRPSWAPFDRGKSPGTEFRDP